MRRNWIFWAFGITAALLFLFSYTQVDLNLTLSRVSVWQSIQKAFQYIGFYLRPLATSLYVGILLSLFGCYIYVLKNVKKKALGLQDVWKLIGLVTVLLVLSYPAAFSYDFFNYMFTAKTLVVYHQNPYAVTPLQFAAIDPWTNFMRWTHLSSAYTPLWIGLSTLPYIVGLGYFILVLFAMKFMVAGFYLLSCWALVSALDTKQKAYGLAFFSLNPLILIESLVSGHNDIVLVSFAMLAVWKLTKKDMWSAWIFLALSIASKFMTIFLLPVFMLKRDRMWMLGAMLIGLLVVLFQREFLPWYWVWILPFVALNAQKSNLVSFAVIVSAGLALSYAPYFYFGQYSALEQVWKTSCIWVSVGVEVVALFASAKKHSHAL